MSKYVLIRNTTKQVKAIGRQGGLGPLMLERGYNRVDADAWELTKKGTTLTDELTAAPGQLAALVEVTLPKENTRGDLDGFKPQDAVAIVKDTFITDLLDVWVQTEQRGSVIAAITERKKELASALVGRAA